LALLSTRVTENRAAVTVTPAWATGFPLASCSCTTGWVVNAMPDWAVVGAATVTASLVAAPVVPVAVKLTGLPARPEAVAPRLLGPAIAPRVQLPTAA